MATDNSEQFPLVHIAALTTKIKKMKSLPPKGDSNPLKILQTAALYTVLWFFFPIIPVHFPAFLRKVLLLRHFEDNSTALELKNFLVSRGPSFRIAKRTLLFSSFRTNDA